MGNFSNNAITDVGKMLLADLQAGAVFIPTRIVIGSGSMTGGATVQGMTEVITPVKSLTINKKKRTPDGKCVFGGVYTNEEVTEPFYFRELALYAKAVYYNADGSVKSEGAETLYSYGNAGATADYMPAYSTSTVVEKQMDLVVWVGNDAQVDLTIKSGVYITHEDFDSHAARHAADGPDPITPASIGAAPVGLVSGIYSAHTDEEFDNVITTAFSNMRDNTSQFITVAVHDGNFMGHWTVEVNRGSATAGSAVAWCYGDTIQKAFFGGVWKPWEYTNPPMYMGVEYRTTERRGSIVVYKKLDTDGVLKYRLEGETAWRTYADEIGAAPAGYGLGTKPQRTVSLADLDSIFYNGWYLLSQPGSSLAGVNFNYASVIVYCIEPISCVQELRPLATNVVLRRYCHQNVWYEWEVENPPMDVGREYRTTERYKGAAVYKKVDAAGNILWRTENETSWRVLISASNVAPASVE